MEISTWLKSSQTDNEYSLLGLNTFDTFLKVCNEFAKWALDDLGLANRSNSYKIWTCWVKNEERNKIKEILGRYSSMKLLLRYYNESIVENDKIGLYIKLDWINNKWEFSYGITNNKKLFIIGNFEYNFTTKLPEHQILKYVMQDIIDFNPREHLLLFTIKQDCFLFNPGFCKRMDPIIINKEVIITTSSLGLWNEQTNKLEFGEAEKYLDIFKDWVKTQKWWQVVHLIVAPRTDKYIDFSLKLK